MERKKLGYKSVMEKFHEDAVPHGNGAIDGAKTELNPIPLAFVFPRVGHEGWNSQEDRFPFPGGAP
jgi:hypothetical protein